MYKCALCGFVPAIPQGIIPVRPWCGLHLFTEIAVAETLNVTLTAAVPLDFSGGLDGRKVARALLWELLPPLLPYVGNCRHRAAELLSVLAAETIGRAKREETEAAVAFRVDEMSDADWEKRYQLHLEMAQHETRELLRRVARTYGK